MMLTMKSSWVSLLLLSSVMCVSARDVILEFKLAYFRPTGACFRQIYGHSAALYGPEVTVQLCDNNSHWYGFASVDYLSKSGRSIGLCDKTKVSLLPLAVGIKCFAPSPCKKADFYLGAGIQPTRVHTRDCSADVNPRQTSWSVGGIFKAGAYLYAPHCVVIDLFVDYSVVRARGKNNCCGSSTVIPLKANVGGAIFGVGLGYLF